MNHFWLISIKLKADQNYCVKKIQTHNNSKWESTEKILKI
jgi:hypothetical protein